MKFVLFCSLLGEGLTPEKGHLSLGAIPRTVHPAQTPQLRWQEHPDNDKKKSEHPTRTGESELP